MSDLWTAGGAAAAPAVAAAPAAEVPPAAAQPAAAAASGVDQEPPGVPFEFMGEVFHRRPVEDYQWELLVFADAAVGGVDAQLLEANAATLRLIRATLIDGEWERFAAHARRQRAQTTRDLMPLVMDIHYRTTSRPTVPPSGSSAGRPTTPASSSDELSSRVIAREEEAGRPDRALVIELAQEAQAAAATGR